MAASIPISHHIRALPPALKAMQAMGYDADACLAGIGIAPGDLLAPNPQLDFSLVQEFRFHRNLLQVSGDPLLGLKLGRAYTVQTYGLFGYAFLSAPTLRQAMTIVSNYGPLTFTLFRVDFSEKAGEGILSFSRHVDIPEDLRSYYVDRDLAASLAGIEPGQATHIKPIGISMMHDGQGQEHAYEQFFECPVSFNAPRTELRVEATVLDVAMPMQDAETSAICQQQCQLLLARMSRSSGFIDSVRQFIVSRPGIFPDIDQVAEKLHITSRTLRRRLVDEGSSYQQILADVRYELAREYLLTSQLPVEKIAALLGYSSPGNFTHAFKRWHGSPPRQYRQDNH
jgi:AraC-like DNA-binding protein